MVPVQDAPMTMRPERLIGAARLNRKPSIRGQARRRALITATKLVLPGIALALLTTMAIWPELDQREAQTRHDLHDMAAITGATLTDAHYHSVDERGRPFTVTAATATQVNPDRINLTQPKGDVTEANGTWLELQSKKGVYRQEEHSLDLSTDVYLYRDDGTTLRTQSATIDLKAGAAAGAEPVHAEGPFGVLDAKGGFTLTDKGTQVLFAGPAHLVLNGSNP